MTTIILTIIGILLAAAAALMVIFYGGDAFNSGSTGAAANTFQNAGTNVASAIELYKVQRGSVAGVNLGPPTMVNSLLNPDCTAGGACLKEMPSIPQTISNMTSYHSISISGDTAYYTVSAISNDVCRRINKNLKLPEEQSDLDAKMGCAYSDGTSVFFARV